MKIFRCLVPGLALLIVGCAEPSEHQQTASHGSDVISQPQVYGSSYPAAPAQTDRALESQVHQAFRSANLGPAAERINVSAHNGTVTLTGSVTWDQERQTIDTLVRNTPGVVSVTDRLQVSASAPQTAPVIESQPAQTSAQMDRSLTDRVVQALRADQSVSPLAQNVIVATRNGAVTLTGNVPSEQARQSVANLVRNVSGVGSVYDNLEIQLSPTGRAEPPVTTQPGSTVTSTTPTTSASVSTGDIFNLHVQGLNDTDRNLAQNILQGLRTDALLASLLPTVNINVSGGRVVLQGTVQSEQQKQTIASVVQRAAGASNVENQLQVNTR
jgi:osmotically-inducible protein OsmY